MHYQVEIPQIDINWYLYEYYSIYIIFAFAASLILPSPPPKKKAK